MPVHRAALQNHRIELRQIRCRRVKSELGSWVLRTFAILRGIAGEDLAPRYHQLAALVLVHHGNAVFLIVGSEEKGVIHAERLKQMSLDEVDVLLSAHDLDQAS